MYVGFCSNKDGTSDGQLMERECIDITEIQQKAETFWKCVEMPLSHSWRSALPQIHICGLKLWRPVCEAREGSACLTYRNVDLKHEETPEIAGALSPPLRTRSVSAAVSRPAGWACRPPLGVRVGRRQVLCRPAASAVSAGGRCRVGRRQVPWRPAPGIPCRPRRGCVGQRHSESAAGLLCRTAGRLAQGCHLKTEKDPSANLAK